MWGRVPTAYIYGLGGGMCAPFGHGHHVGCGHCKWGPDLLDHKTYHWMEGPPLLLFLLPPSHPLTSMAIAIMAHQTSHIATCTLKHKHIICPHVLLYLKLHLVGNSPQPSWSLREVGRTEVILWLPLGRGRLSWDAANNQQLTHIGLVNMLTMIWSTDTEKEKTICLNWKTYWNLSERWWKTFDNWQPYYSILKYINIWSTRQETLSCTSTINKQQGWFQLCLSQ